MPFDRFESAAKFAVSLDSLAWASLTRTPYEFAEAAEDWTMQASSGEPATSHSARPKRKIMQVIVVSGVVGAVALLLAYVSTGGLP